MRSDKIKPSKIIDYKDLPKNAIKIEHKNPELYGWYFDENYNKWFPHRKPTIIELDRDKFNN